MKKVLGGASSNRLAVSGIQQIALLQQKNALGSRGAPSSCTKPAQVVDYVAAAGKCLDPR